MLRFSVFSRIMETETILKNRAILKNLMTIGKQIRIIILLFGISCILGSCSSNLYFTVEQRSLIERNDISPKSLQYYVDRDVILKREMSSQEATTQITGKVIVENGKYIHIITLRKNTPGVCTYVYSNNQTLDISFDMGEGKYLTFGVNKAELAKPSTIYNIRAKNWVNKVGEITYDGETYYVQPEGFGAQLMFKKLTKDKLKVEKNTMKGRKVNKE